MVQFSSKVVVEKDVSLREYPQGHLLCAFGTSQAFELDGIGARILQGLDRPTSVCDLIAQLAAEFHEPVSLIEKDVLSFLDDCLKLGVLRCIPNKEEKLSDGYSSEFPQKTETRQT